MLDSPPPTDEATGVPASGFGPLGLRQDEHAEPPTLEVAITMPRVRVGGDALDAGPVHPAESELWARMQHAAQLARLGKAQGALSAFESVATDARAVGEPTLVVIAAKAAYNRAVVLEKLLGDITGAEGEMERLHDAFGGHAMAEARTVAGRAGLHAARLAGLSGRLGVALSRYRERLGRFRDVLPPAELQTFHVDYLRQRSSAKERGLEVTTRLTILPPPGVGAAAQIDTPRPTPANAVGDLGVEAEDAAVADLRVRHDAAQARVSAELERVRRDVHGEIEIVRGQVVMLEQRLATTRVDIESRQDRLYAEWQKRHDELRTDHRRRMRLLRSEVQHVAAEQRSTRVALVLVSIFGIGAICVALWMFQHSLATALAPLLRHA